MSPARDRTPATSASTSPTASNDEKTIYVAGTSGIFYAVDSCAGTLEWSYTGDYAVYSAAVVASDGTVYFSTDSGNVYALDSHGNLKWKNAVTRYASNAYLQLAIGHDNTLFVPRSFLYALNPDGSVKWHFAQIVGSSPVIDGEGIVYFVVTGFQHTDLYAVDSVSGATKWTVSLGFYVNNLIVGQNGHLLAIGSDFSQEHTYYIILSA